MNHALTRFIPPSILFAFRRLRETRAWAARDYAPPSPPHIKRAVLRRHGREDATWIETGTYLGDTSAFLATLSRRVVTIEPEPALFARAARRLAHSHNVEVINGLSEDILPQLLPTINGNVCLWLDGHYSAGITFKGRNDTPIADELAALEASLHRFVSVAVLIDDVRCFDGALGNSAYPPLEFLVDWARRNGLSWAIEHDIFVAKRGG